MGYDAFISYSHAADGQLAPRLQAGLQRLAKPWYRRRALNVFRDETGLSANPGLWTSISQALDSSEHFILLASPQAAASEWVNREVEQWLATKSAETILPVVTDGAWTWDPAANDFDWNRSDAVPPALAGAFSEEPRHVDMRWAREDVELSLRHSRFRDQVAELAAPLHGRSKDELEGDDVRQHRRTMRVAWGAGLSLVVLTVAAVLGAVLAVEYARASERNAAEAAAQRDLAESNADLAKRNEAQAEDNARQAEENADRAAKEAARAEANALRESEARELAEENERQAEENLLLAEKNAREARVNAAEAKRQTELARQQELFALREADRAQKAEKQATVALVAEEAARRDAERAAEAEALALTQEEQARKDAEDAQALEAAARRRAEEQARLATSRSLAANATRSNAPVIGVSNRTNLDESLLVAVQALRTERTPAARDALHTTVRAVENGVEDFLHPGANKAAIFLNAVAATPDRRVIAAGDDEGRLYVWEGGAPYPKTVFEGDSSYLRALAIGPDGRYLATDSNDGSVRVWDLATGRAHLRGTGRLHVSPNGRHVALSDGSGRIDFVDLATGSVRVREGILRESVIPNLGRLERDLPGGPFSPDGRFAIGSSAGTLTIWDLDNDVRRQGIGDDDDLVAFDDAGTAAVVAHQESTASRVEFLDATRDGLVSAGKPFPVDGAALALGPSPGGGEVAVRTPTHVLRYERQGELLGGIDLTGISAHADVSYSPDGQVLALTTADAVTLFVTLSADRLAIATTPAGFWFLPDGRRVLVGAHDTQSGDVGWYRMELQTLKTNEEFEADPTGQAIGQPFVAARTSPGGRYVATVHVGQAWDLERFDPGPAAPAATTLSLDAAVGDDGRGVMVGFQGLAARVDFRRSLALGDEIDRITGGEAVRPDVSWDREITAIGPGQDRYAVVSGTAVEVRRLDSGSVLHRTDLHVPLEAVTYSTSGHLLVSTGSKVVVLRANGSVLGQVAADSFALSGDGSRMATLVEGSRPVHVYAFGSGLASPIALIDRSGSETAAALALDARGRRLATMTEAGRSEVWDVASGQLVASWSQSASRAYDEAGRVAIALAPDGDLVVTKQKDGRVVLWDVLDGAVRERGALPEQFAGTASLVFSPDGSLLATDWDVGLWDPIRRERVGPGLAAAEDARVQFTSDGRHLLRYGEGVAVRYLVDDEGLVERACATARRNLTRTEWNRFQPLGDYRTTCPAWPLDPPTARRVQ